VTTEAQEHRTEFNPNPMQKAFIESRAKADLFSSRVGEGKSTALCWANLLHTIHNPGADWAIVRDTWENLQKTTQKTFFEWFPPGVYGSYHHTHKTFTWAEGVARGSVVFMGMDDPKDASKLMSLALGGIAFDEPAPAVGSVGIDEMIFDIAMSRLRQKGMKWYSCKLAENNPDEAHWTYRKFVQPGTDGFRLWQPPNPENEQNLPPNYYGELRRLWRHRPDLVRRFVEGEFGFQQVGKAVTPQWADRLHLATGLTPIPRRDLYLLWDFGHNPTCIITQITPLGHWNILDAMVGEDEGVEELIVNQVRPVLEQRYKLCPLHHIGDPAGMQREQTSIHQSAVRLLKRELGGSWRKGPVKIWERIEPLRAVLTRAIGGRGMVQVDRERAAAVWQALRGGWHFHVARTGVISGEPAKDQHSHPGDAMGYGAAILFPLGKRKDAARPAREEAAPSYWGRKRDILRPEGSGVILPKPGSVLRLQGDR
jgi:hypothetical protein